MHPTVWSTAKGGLEPTKKECGSQALSENIKRSRTIENSWTYGCSAIAPTRDSKTLKPSVQPSSGSQERSGCGIVPNTLRSGQQIPRTLSSEPLGLASEV